MATGRSDFPEPGEQCAGLPVYFPRRAGRACYGHQRRDENGGNACAGGTGERRCAGFRLPCVWRGPDSIWAGVHHSEAVRSARAGMGSDGGGQGRDGDPGWRRIRSIWTNTGNGWNGCWDRAHELMRIIDAQGQAEAEACGVSGRRERKDSARCHILVEEKIAHTDADRIDKSHPRKGRGPGHEPGTHPGRGSRICGQSGMTMYRSIIRTATETRRNAFRSADTDQQPKYFRVRDGAHGRRRRAGGRRYAAFSRHHPACTASDQTEAGIASGVGSLCCW